MGVPEMSRLYHHHNYEVVQSFAPTYLHDPRRPLVVLKRRLGMAEPPFPWFRFRA
jgi:hypothetical protein